MPVEGESMKLHSKEPQIPGITVPATQDRESKMSKVSQKLQDAHAELSLSLQTVKK